MIGEINISDTNKLVVDITEYKGKKGIDIRDFFKTAKMDKWQPTKRGVRIDTQHAGTLVSILEKVEDKLTNKEA